MQKKLLFILFAFLFSFQVKAASCPVEMKVKINNESGSVNAISDSFEYEYPVTDSEVGETTIEKGYLGTIKIYNLTENIYAVVANGQDKKTVNYNKDLDNIVAVSTGAMNVVKEYTVSIYPTNEECGTAAIRTIQVAVPRINRFYTMPICSTYPDYYYCSKFLTVEDISNSDFDRGIENYIASEKNKGNESRKEGIVNITKTFINKHRIIISIIIVVAIIAIVVINKVKKSKERVI